MYNSMSSDWQKGMADKVKYNAICGVPTWAASPHLNQDSTRIYR